VGLGTFVYNLRYPGQYFQAETGLSYNYFRDYDGVTGRYIESDPLGLPGGVNTYAYAKENPVSNIDPFGLFTLDFNVTEIPTLFVTGGYDGYTTSSVTHFKCSCSPTCGNNWQLKGCSGTLQVDVQIQILMFPLSKVLARRAEQQHVDDYGAARSIIEADITRKENSLKGNQYPDEKTCVDAAKAVIGPLLKSWQERVAVASYNTYDLPGGPHNH
jgi:RHS repeat-associated protein